MGSSPDKVVETAKVVATVITSAASTTTPSLLAVADLAISL